MKNPFFMGLLLISVLCCSSATSCDKNDGNAVINNNDDSMTNNKIIIKVGSKTFTASLLNNNTAKAFKGILPLSINMVELNGNEKYYDLPNSLPANASNPGTLQNGDLMLYGSRTLVLFYKTFSNSYQYTKFGHIEDVSGLAEALGPGTIPVTFELKSE